MTTTEAARLLEVAPTATPEQIETRFLDLRRKLEDKIAKAPTPGLQAKYRASLAEITTAFETLTLAADSSDLPVLQRATPAKPAAAPFGASPASAVESPAHPAASARPAPKKSGGNLEFVLVAIIAVALLGGGGWWVMKIRTEAAEKARIEAVAKAEAERKAAAEKADAEKEKARQETSFAQLRATQAEAKIRWDGVEKDETVAERKLVELKADARNTKDVPPPQQAEMQARLAAEGDYVDWLQPYVARHPVKTLLAKLDALLSAKAMDAAAPVATEITQSLTTAEQTIADQKKSLLALSSPVRLTSEPDGLAYSYTDAYGRTVEGTTPFTGELPFGALAVRIQRTGWVDYKLKTRVQRGEPLQLNAAFRSGKLQVNSTPGGLPFEADNTFGYVKRGTTPAELTEVPTGGVSIKVTRAGWPDIVQSAQVPADGAQTVLADFAPGALQVTSTPSGAGVFLQGRQLGVTPLTLPDQVPGSFVLELRLKGYKNASARGEVRAKETTLAATTLIKSPNPVSGQPWTIPDLGLAMVPIAPGSFMMGSATSDQADEKPATQVALTQSYWLGKTEVTQREWTAVMGSNPSKFRGENLPVEQVSWDDAMEFCRKLTARERTADRLPAGLAYTLPTEAQWEYACRAGTSGEYAGNLDAMAWYVENSGNQTHPVGSKQANAWGLSDVHGNVLEWCRDWSAWQLLGGSVTDPTGASSGSLRVNRGGCWGNDASYCRSAFRRGLEPGYRGNDLGFRLALSSVP